MLIAAAIGGTAEKLGGGKFANGAVTGAYVMMFNHLGEHKREIQKRDPIIFITISSMPEGFNQQEYMELLRNRLIENGFNEQLAVVKNSLGGRIAAWWNCNPTADIHIRGFQTNDMKIAFETGGLVAGFAKPLSNEAVVYPGLSPLSKNQNRVLPIDYYVAASMHELGHAIFGFRHTSTGIMMGKLICPSCNFTNEQQSTIRKSIWGQ